MRAGALAPSLVACFAMLQPLRAQTPSPQHSPDAGILIGTWSGQAHHGSASADLSLRFERDTGGRIVTREWLAEINAYGSPIGFLIAQANGAFAVPESGIELR